MALCSSCQNIVPQSAGRCPVCGNAPGISPDEFLAELDSNPDSGPDRDAQHRDAQPTTSGEARPAARGRVAPNGRVFTPPPLPGDQAADRTPSSESGPTAGDTPRAKRTRRGSASVVSASTIASDDLSLAQGDLISGLEEPQSEMTRTVRAISNRLDADIRIGRRRGHAMLISVAPIAAAALLLFATYSAYEFADLDRPERVETADDAPAPGTLAFGEEQSNEAQERASEVADQVHEVVALNCGISTTANVIAISPTRFVTNSSTVQNDTDPVLRFGDGTSRVGTVIGIDRTTALAVIEVAAVGSIGELEWGVTDRVFTNPDVVVVERFGAAIQGTPATADQIVGVVGLVQSFSFSGSTFRPGSAVLNGDGFIIGMVDDTGRSAISGSELSAAFGRVIARPSTPTSTCAPVEEPTDPDAANPDGTTDAGSTETETTADGSTAGGNSRSADSTD